MRKGEPFTLSVYSLGAHSGTHIDAPMHFIANGAPVDRIALDPLIGAPVSSTFRQRAGNRCAELNKHDWRGVKRVLFRNSQHIAWLDGFVQFHRTSHTSPRSGPAPRGRRL